MTALCKFGKSLFRFARLPGVAKAQVGRNLDISSRAVLGDICAGTLGAEEALKVTHTRGYSLYGLFAFPLGARAEALTLNKTWESSYGF